MAIKELDAGQKHTFAPTALRVELTGAAHGGGIVLTAVDQAGHESETVRLTDVDVVLTPEPRRLRLVAAPTRGGSFPAGTSLGLTLRTEGASVAAEQILVSTVDVGALAHHELAVLEFASDRAILTVSSTRGGHAPVAPPRSRSESFISGELWDGAAAAAARTGPDDSESTWLRWGRYAFRDAHKLGTSGPPPTGWGIVLDGSASMCRLHSLGQLESLLHVVCGTYVQWAGEWPLVSMVAGVRALTVDAAATDPLLLANAAFGEAEPSSWSSICETTRAALRRIPPAGAMLIVTDGVPGDIERLIALSAENPAVRFTIVTTGVSRFGLTSDGEPDWWAEELLGLDRFASAANCAAVAVRLRVDNQLELGEARAAELALAITSPLTMASS